MAKMKRDTLEQLLSQQQNNAVGALNGTIGRHRSNLMDRYNGELYGDEVKDRSSIVDTAVRDTVESIKPELMDIFFGADGVVEFTPKGADDVDAAKQETETVNHVFTERNDGFMVLYSWFTDALLLKTGYVKRYWDERKYSEIEEYDDLSPEEAANLVAELEASSDEVNFLERSGGIDDETQAVEPLYLKIERIKTEKRYVVEPAPPEEIMVSPQWHRLDFRGCPFVAHKRSMPMSDLVEMGFDKKEIEDLPDFDGRLDTEEAENRYHGEQYSENELGNPPDESMREVLVYENYIRADYDGDGIAELLQVFTAGENGHILKRGRQLAIEQVTDIPVEVLSPLPIPHKHYGMSVGEMVMELARIRTVLARQMLDNTVIGNNPDVYVDEDQATDDTYEDLQITQAGGRVIRGRGPNGITPIPVQNTVAQSLAALEYTEAILEKRTGVTRGNQGIDPNSLAPMAQDTVKNLMTAAQKRVLLIARIFAETGVKQLFVNMHRDLRAGPWKSIAMQLGDDFVEVNPRLWKHRSDMTVNVGLGTGDRDAQFGRLSMIYGEQKEGMSQGVVSYKHLHHTLTKMVELSGFKDVANFFPTPEQVSQAQAETPEKPDPMLMMAQLEAQKAQDERMSKQLELQIKQFDAETKRMVAATGAEKAQTERLNVIMTDDRQRDIEQAKIEQNGTLAQDRDTQ